MMNDVILQCCTKGLEVNAEMVIETLVLSVNQGIPENGVHIVIRHRRTVLAEVFANHHTVGTIDLRSLSRTCVDNRTHAGRLTE